MFKFLEKIQNEETLKIPLEQINLLISQKGTLNILPYDVLEKICANVLFDYLGFVDGENLSPEKRLELFIDGINSLTIEKDFLRLCGENRLFELSLLLDRDETDEISWYYNDPILLTTCVCNVIENLEVLTLLHRKNRVFTTVAMYCASRNGKLDFVKWLHENKPNFDCVKGAIDWVAEKGHLDVVKYLHENGYYCTTSAMDLAARNGHLEVVMFLLENRPEDCCVISALDWATENGHHQIVSFLRTKL